MRRVRILHVIENLNYGGMERLLADLVRRVDGGRFDSHVLALQYLGRFAAGLEQHATLHIADPQPAWSMLWPLSLIRQMRGIAPDVVHSHSGVWYKSSLAARAAGARLVMHTEHGRQRPDPLLARLVDGLASRRTDVVIAVSQSVADQLAAGIVRDPRRIRVIANGVDTAAHHPRPDPGTLRRELRLHPDAPVIGSIGRLEPVKGYDVLLTAFALLRHGWKGDPPPALVIAGDGAEHSRLRELARGTAAAEDVHLLGWRDDVAELHATFSLFAMSSHSEGTSVSLLEAMSAGLCPVVTDVGGNAAVLGDELRHRLVAPANPEALAAALGEALRSPERLAADGRAARRRVEGAFGLDRMVAAYEALYSSADDLPVDPPPVSHQRRARAGAADPAEVRHTTRGL